jgi:hypothetical protein
MDGQKENYLSIEGDVNYYHHFISRDTKNNFNYGFSLTLWQHIKKIKVGIGTNYSTKNYYYNVSPNISSSFANKREYKLKYLNFPFLLDVNILNPNNRLYIDILSGIIFNKVIDYDIVTYYTNKQPLHENVTDAEMQLGLSIRLGSAVSYIINKNISFSTTPFADFKLILNSINQRPDYSELPDNRFSVGLKIGVEYLF